MILHNRSHVNTDGMHWYSCNMNPPLWIKIALVTVGVDGFRKHQKPSLLNLNWVAFSQNFRFGKNHWDPLDNIEKKNYLNIFISFNQCAVQKSKYINKARLNICLQISNAVFPHTVAAAPILFWNCKSLKISNSFRINRRYFWNWCIRSTKQITEIIYLWWGETNYLPEVPR